MGHFDDYVAGFSPWAYLSGSKHDVGQRYAAFARKSVSAMDQGAA